jgi:putative transcriptional regulator
MKPKMFEDLLESVREGGSILRGQRKASRRFEVGATGIRAIRERTSLSQSEFASLIGVSVKTLQNWEQDRRRPTGPAGTPLKIIAYDPRLAVKAIHQTSVPARRLVTARGHTSSLLSARFSLNCHPSKLINIWPNSSQVISRPSIMRRGTRPS